MFCFTLLLPNVTQMKGNPLTVINLMPQIFTRFFSDGNSEPIVHSHLICVHVYFDLQNSIIPTLICCLKDHKRAEWSLF